MIAESELEQLSFQDAPMIKSPPPGPKSKAMLEVQQKLETQAVVYPRFWPIAIDEAKGATIRDVDGNCYIDWVSGISVLNVGHRNPEIVRHVETQLGKLWHGLELPTEARIQFLRALNSVLPDGLQGRAKVLFTVTGGDACETAMSLARWVTKKHTIIAFEGAYHGIHHGVVNATASSHYKEYAGIPDYGIFRVPYAYAYRSPRRLSAEEYAQEILDYIEHLIDDPHSGLGGLAGIMVEPIQGEGGYIVPPKNFLPGLREIASEHSVPLIIDEVQTGFGRTGQMWGCQLTNTAPDIMCVSKTVGGGFPASLVAYREEYDRNLPPAFHLGTYRGNPVALAAGHAIIEYLTTSGLIARGREVGTYLIKRFLDVADKTPAIGEVRGEGFMIGIELVKDRNNRQPAEEFAKSARTKMLSKGLLIHTCGHYGNVLRFMAPLIISRKLIDSGLSIFDDVLSSASG